VRLRRRDLLNPTLDKADAQAVLEAAMLRHHSEADVANTCDERNLVARSIQLGSKVANYGFFAGDVFAAFPAFTSTSVAVIV
jgi:hypothetical protein